MKSMTVVIESGALREEIEEYLEDISTDRCEMVFNHSSENWVINLKDSYVNVLGSIRTSITPVVFQGDAETVELLVCHFRLRFLSAGG